MTRSQIAVASTNTLVARRAEIVDQDETVENYELDFIDEELALREHDHEDPSSGLGLHLEN